MESTNRELQHSFVRLEDSLSLRENQKSFPEDLYVEEENRRLARKIHEKMTVCREMEKKLEMKFC